MKGANHLVTPDIQTNVTKYCFLWFGRKTIFIWSLIFFLAPATQALWLADNGSLNRDSEKPAYNPSIAVAPDGIIYVAWIEKYKVNISSWNGIVWSAMPGVDRTGDVAREAHLSVAPNGTIYIGWIEGGGPDNVFVSQWDGNKWVNSGNTLTSSYQSSWLNLAVSSDNTLYTAWTEYNGIEYQFFVSHWNGSSWEKKGDSISNNVEWASLAIAPNGVPYVAWTERISAVNQLFVRHWSGSSWESDGVVNRISTQVAKGASIAIAPNGIPYVAWAEYASNWQIYVSHKYGGNWVSDGGKLNNEYADFPKLAITASGIPYVSWIENRYGTSIQTFVSHLSGDKWVSDGDSLNRSNTQDAYYPCLALSANGVPYVAWGEGKSGPYQIYVSHWGTLPPATITPTPMPATPTITTTPEPAGYNDHRLRVLNSRINPTRGELARIRWYQPHDIRVTLVIYNMVGDRITTLAESQDFAPKQMHEVTWDGKNWRGEVVGSGIYIVSLESGSYKAYSKCAVIK